MPLAIRTATSTATASADCPLITAYMKLGWNNPADQVAKLQAFLKNSEHLNVSVTGIFDQQTEQAVEAFQRKYLETIMGPWSATKPSGTVYITTIKKINEIACNQPLTLDPKELSTIAQYVKNLASGARNETAQTIEVGAVSSSTTVSGPVVPIGPALIGQNVTASSSNAAAVGNASVIQRFWSFIKSIF
ncbi:peptidoglycan-binding protein [Patescibacteria group bacterium]|nr:peptidoglycan-binding protein [Patescibacteria group bacterium]MDE1946715.1 peptidoglycan-binding protein [Patescibacteria group bacterium]MDE2010982.1 peptidoglycan-binding protein [Patescibacteria group bacterium]